MSSDALENEEDRSTLGAVLGGMIAFDHAIQNSLTDSHLDSAIDWAQRFRDFYDEVEKVNRDLYVDYALQAYGYDRETVNQSIRHYESMKMTGREEN